MKVPFKRIFFGLLIFTVLSSEGTAFINRIVAPLRGGYTGSLEIGILSPCLQDEGGIANSLKNNVSSISSLEELLRKQNAENTAFFESGSGSGFYCGYPYSYMYSLNSIKYESKLLFHGSDSSPPFFVM